MSDKVPFDDLTYDKFRQLATSDQLTRHEKVGFPDSYREGKEDAIFSDIESKLSCLNNEGKCVLEIGPGCSRLPVMLTELCERNGHDLHFVDSQEMLALLPDGSHVRKWSGRYPDEVPDLFDLLSGKVDAVIAYSVIQYIFAEGNLWDFLDRSLLLLADGGEILFGDVPNISMRKRFFSSSSGIECHRKYTGRDELPDVRFNQVDRGQIDDSIVLAILARARAQGYHAWAMPQNRNLPMSNRREDILIRKP